MAGQETPRARIHHPPRSVGTRQMPIFDGGGERVATKLVQLGGTCCRESREFRDGERTVGRDSPEGQPDGFEEIRRLEVWDRHNVVARVIPPPNRGFGLGIALSRRFRGRHATPVE